MTFSLPRFASQATRLALVAVLAFSDIAGCASGGNMFSSGIDKSDACGVQHRDFADSRNYYLSETVQGALFGAAGGAALGALTAWATGGNAGQGAAVGAVAGGVTGAYAGYWNAKQKDIKDQQALAQSIYDDVRKASTEMDRVTTTFAALKQCRFEQAALIKGQLRQSLMTHGQAAAALADQQKRFAAELTLARQYGAKMADQDQSFRFAAVNLAQGDVVAQQALNAPHRSARAPSSGGGPQPGEFIVTGAANVRRAPDPSSPRVAGLYPGARVKPTDEPAQNGFRHITFNGGQTGYVSENLLSPAGAGGGAPVVAAVPAAPAPPPDSSNRRVAVAVNATETIPEKREHYDSSVREAESASTVAFNLEASSPS